MIWNGIFLFRLKKVRLGADAVDFCGPFAVCEIQITRCSPTRALTELLCIQKCHLHLFNKSSGAACDSTGPWRRCRSASEPLVCSFPCRCVPKQPDRIVVCERSEKFMFCTDIYHLLPLIFVIHGWLCTLKSAVLPHNQRKKLNDSINLLESLWMWSWGAAEHLALRQQPPAYHHSIFTFSCWYPQSHTDENNIWLRERVYFFPF